MRKVVEQDRSFIKDTKTQAIVNSDKKGYFAYSQKLNLVTLFEKTGIVEENKLKKAIRKTPPKKNLIIWGSFIFPILILVILMFLKKYVNIFLKNNNEIIVDIKKSNKTKLLYTK